ncbi:hypothetical protein EPN90_03445 [Patescibacteria group bacterium]|nr:MAG: hypothetical protein EPN90_03445 [Patescibacteria group bacterium]
MLRQKIQRGLLASAGLLGLTIAGCGLSTEGDLYGGPFEDAAGEFAGAGGGVGGAVGETEGKGGGTSGSSGTGGFIPPDASDNGETDSGFAEAEGGTDSETSSSADVTPESDAGDSEAGAPNDVIPNDVLAEKGETGAPDGGDADAGLPEGGCQPAVKQLTTAPNAGSPTAAFGYGVLAFTWTKVAGKEAVYFGTADATGKRVIGDTLVAPLGSPETSSPFARESALITTMGGWLYAIVDSSPGVPSIRFGLVTPSGNVSSSPTLSTLGGAAAHPAIAEGVPGSVVIAYEGKAGQDGFEDIFLGRWASNLVAQNVVCATPGVSLAPQIVWTGASYTVVWQENQGGLWRLRYRHVSSDGTPLGSGCSELMAGNQLRPSALWFVNTGAIAWVSVGGDAGIRLGTFDQGWNLQKTVKVAGPNAGTSYDRPHLATNGLELAVVWEETSGGNTDIRFARFQKDGTPTGSTVNVSNSPGTSWGPKAIWDGNAWEVVWEDNGVGGRQIFWTKVVCP